MVHTILCGRTRHASTTITTITAFEAIITIARAIVAIVCEALAWTVIVVIVGIAVETTSLVITTATIS